MKKIVLTFLLIVSFMLKAGGQSDPVMKGLAAINEDALKAQLGFLASDWMEGRETGQRGEFLAADYIASMLQLYGVKPGGDYPARSRLQSSLPPGTGRSYFQNFILVKSTPGNEQIMKLISGEGSSKTTLSFSYNTDFTARQVAAEVEIEAPVVFAGYGFKNDQIGFNDFKGIDVKGKYVLKIAGVPEFVTKVLSASEILSSVRESEEMLRKAGAAGIVEFSPSSLTVGVPSRPDFSEMSPAESASGSYRRLPNYSLPGTGAREIMPRITITEKAANEILKGTEVLWEDYRRMADNNQVYKVKNPAGRLLYFKSENEVTSVPVRNVIGIIEGKKTDEIIVLGAHYDHMGMGGGFIWNGADDNGSGTVGIMTIARAIMASGVKPEKTIIIALWTAEEAGLLGSRYYVNNLPYPVDNLKMNLNLDMISRYISDDDTRKVIMTYSSSCPNYRELTEKNLEKHGIDLVVEYQPSDNPPGGSDHQSFIAAGVPIMRFKPGHREDYHRPTDETRTINWDIMEKIVKICFANVWELANE